MKNLEDLKIEIRKLVLPGTGRYPNLVVPNLHRDSVLGTTISIALRTHATRVHCERIDQFAESLYRIGTNLQLR